jgi:chaperone required for assembly of F1-ATPase
MNNPKIAASQKSKLKRFYQDVSLADCDGGWQVCFDGKPMRSPAKASLVLPARRLAEEVADEWQRQEQFVELDGMPHTQFSCAATDYTAVYRADVEAETLAYITTDLLCYRAQEPQDMVQRQNEQWNPWVRWAEERFNLRMALVVGIMPVEQSGETLDEMRRQIAALDDFSLTAVWLVAKHTGSLLLAFAVQQGALEAPVAFNLSRLEEDFQNARWGVDEEARSRRHSTAAEMEALGKFISLIQ